MEGLTQHQCQWIADHALPWEPYIRHGLRCHTRISLDEVDDFIQETYSRLCGVDVSQRAATATAHGV
jgi:hypothetical protein